MKLLILAVLVVCLLLVYLRIEARKDLCRTHWPDVELNTCLQALP